MEWLIMLIPARPESKMFDFYPPKGYYKYMNSYFIHWTTLVFWWFSTCEMSERKNPQLYYSSQILSLEQQPKV